MATGIFSTLLIPETKGKSLEDLSNEDQAGFVSGIICLLTPILCSVLKQISFVGVRDVHVDNTTGLVAEA
jgi:hypothetical protein